MRCTTAMRFVDTNVLVYAVSTADDEADKAGKALALLAGRELALSTQVLQEFYVQATHGKRPNPLTHQQAVSFVTALQRFPVQEITLAVVHAAFALRERYGISYWDGAILAAARALGCDTVLSEDLNEAQDYDGVRVVNPFR